MYFVLWCLVTVVDRCPVKQLLSLFFRITKEFTDLHTSSYTMWGRRNYVNVSVNASSAPPSILCTFTIWYIILAMWRFWFYIVEAIGCLIFDSRSKQQLPRHKHEFTAVLGSVHSIGWHGRSFLIVRWSFFDFGIFLKSKHFPSNTLWKEVNAEDHRFTEWLHTNVGGCSCYQLSLRKRRTDASESM